MQFQILEKSFDTIIIGVENWWSATLATLAAASEQQFIETDASGISHASNYKFFAPLTSLSRAVFAVNWWTWEFEQWRCQFT